MERPSNLADDIVVDDIEEVEEKRHIKGSLGSK